jgi:hypothetical protein
MKLNIFDFDGTLVRTPCDTPENRRKYEEAHGLPWLISKSQSVQLTRKHKRHIGIRRGWWGRRETLEPPLVPDPTPADLFITSTCKALLASKADPDCVSIVMTGRHRGISNQVLRILDDGGLVKVVRRPSQGDKLFIDLADENLQVYFFGDDGPRPNGNKPTSTLPWKIWMIDQFLSIYPETQLLEIWEDRIEHVEEFRQLNNCIEPNVEVHFVKG